MLFLGSIPIIHKQSKDENNKNKDLKKYLLYSTKIYIIAYLS